jgi:methylphosphotriester-DNA--protein-cysteine methyltransferase
MAAYQDNLRAAQFLPPPPEVAALRQVLHRDPEETRRFFKAYFGLVPRESFFNPDNLQRIMQTA